MSKLQKTYKYVGPVSKLMVFGSFAVGVWLYAEYLAHRESSNWAKHTWFANPKYHPNAALCWAMVITCIVGLLISRYARPSLKPASYFHHDLSGDINTISVSEQDVAMLGIMYLSCISVMMATAVIAWGIITWLIHFGSYNWRVFNPTTHSGGPIWYVSMWQVVVIGWSLLAFSWTTFKLHELENLPRPQSESEPLIAHRSES